MTGIKTWTKDSFTIYSYSRKCIHVPIFQKFLIDSIFFPLQLLKFKPDSLVWMGTSNGKFTAESQVISEGLVEYGLNQEFDSLLDLDKKEILFILGNCCLKLSGSI